MGKRESLKTLEQSLLHAFDSLEARMEEFKVALPKRIEALFDRREQRLDAMFNRLVQRIEKGPGHAGEKQHLADEPRE